MWWNTNTHRRKIKSHRSYRKDSLMHGEWKESYNKTKPQSHMKRTHVYQGKKKVLEARIPIHEFKGRSVEREVTVLFSNVCTRKESHRASCSNSTPASGDCVVCMCVWLLLAKNEGRDSLSFSLSMFSCQNPGIKRGVPSRLQDIATSCVFVTPENVLFSSCCWRIIIFSTRALDVHFSCRSRWRCNMMMTATNA